MDRLPTLPERKAVREALRAVGMSDRQAKALLTAWKLVVGQAQAEADEYRERCEELERLLRS